MNDKAKIDALRAALEDAKGWFDLFDQQMQRTRIDDALALTADASEQAPDDPMDWPLPCDVTVGHGTIGKGCALRTLVARMKVLYDMAQAALPPVSPEFRVMFPTAPAAPVADTGAVEALRAALRSVNAVAIERGDKFGACDQIDNDGQPYQSAWFADLLKGVPTAPASPSPTADSAAGWLPVETAPKDGTDVLLYLGAPWNKVEKAYWFPLWENWQRSDDIPDPVRDEYCGIGSGIPTHWQPLPPAPSVPAIPRTTTDSAADARDAARWSYIAEHATSHGGGKGFMITCWVPVDHEDMGCGIDAAIASMRPTTEKEGA